MTTGNITIYSKLRKYWTSNLALKRNKLAKSKIYIFFFETYRGQTLTKSINITFNKNCQRTLNILHLFPNFIDLFPISKWILNFGPALPALPLTLSVGHSTNTKKRFLANITIRWWLVINTKNYNISSKVIIKAPRNCSNKCYSIATLHTYTFIIIFYYISSTKQAIF